MGTGAERDQPVFRPQPFQWLRNTLGRGHARECQGGLNSQPFTPPTPVLPDVSGLCRAQLPYCRRCLVSGRAPALTLKSPDWVANLDVNFGGHVHDGTQARRSTAFSGETNRVDFYSTVAAWRVTASVTYFAGDDDSVVSPVRESMTIRGSLQLADNWYVGYRGTRDLGRGITPASGSEPHLS